MIKLHKFLTLSVFVLLSACCSKKVQRNPNFVEYDYKDKVLFRDGKPNNKSQPKKIVVFGANGKTGFEVIKTGKSHGHSMIAAVRTAYSIKNKVDDAVVIKEYSFDNKAEVDAIVKDADAVVIAVGSGDCKKAKKSTDIYSKSVSIVIESMKKHKVKRLITITSSGVDYDRGAPWIYRKFIRPALMNTYMDMMKSETILDHNKDIEWTVVRPSYLKNGKYDDFIVADRYIGKGDFKIKRGDVAEFIIHEIVNNNWVHKKPVLSDD